MNEINLGDTAQDTVTGFKGTVVAIVTWIHGCRRMILQPKVGKDGKLPENQTFDEPGLKLIKRKAKPKAKRGGTTGGPIPNMVQKNI